MSGRSVETAMLRDDGLCVVKRETLKDVTSMMTSTEDCTEKQKRKSINNRILDDHVSSTAIRRVAASKATR